MDFTAEHIKMEALPLVSSASAPKSAMEDLLGDIFVPAAGDSKIIDTAVGEEMSRYRKESAIPATSNPLDWWRQNEARFPLIALMAKSYLAVPATATTSDRIFSASGDIAVAKRGVVPMEYMDQYIFLEKHLIC